MFFGNEDFFFKPVIQQNEQLKKYHSWVFKAKNLKQKTYKKFAKT
jgi:hypothetical protein